MFIKFLLENYRFIIDAIAIFIGIILLIVRKRPVSDILSFIYINSVEAVKAAEDTGLKDQLKLEYAIRLVKEALIKNYPGLGSFQYTKLITTVIEDILTTPKKKED